MKKITRKEALEFHSKGRAGKIEISLSKPVKSQRELSLAYTPGVAEPCKEIAKDREKTYIYTNKGNTVGIVTDGTAVLGLGDIGPEAALPVMEGKAALFKSFGGVDAFPICLDTKETEEIIKAVKLMAPGFGGINLEDISAPRCFEIERRLKEELEIPVFHDDQHGTAVISLAGLLNALELVGKKIEGVKVVFNGAGAAGIACAKLYKRAGVKNIILCDSKGVIYKGRKENMNPYKEELAVETEARTLAEAMKGADIFVGVSKGEVVSREMVKAMAARPIIFALANPVPEIWPEEVEAVRDDALMATGRSDYPNQINNVLGFPFIFRGALDVRAKEVNEEMKLAAAGALAELAKEKVTEEVLEAYDLKKLEFGKDYLIPKPLDKRALERVGGAVAKAAMESGAARRKIDIARYEQKLKLGRWGVN